jgi:hypothetical protein
MAKKEISVDDLLQNKLLELGVVYLTLPSHTESSLADYYVLNFAGVTYKIYSGSYLMFNMPKSIQLIKTNKTNPQDVKVYTIKKIGLEDNSAFLNSKIKSPTSVLRILDLVANGFVIPFAEALLAEITRAKLIVHESCVTTEEMKKPNSGEVDTFFRNIGVDYSANLLSSSYVSYLGQMFTRSIAIKMFGEESVSSVSHLINNGSIVLYFPLLEVKNENGAKHNMYDCFVSINSNFTPTFARGTLSRAERAANYLFSHAKTTSSFFSFQDCCLGDSGNPLPTSISRLRNSSAHSNSSFWTGLAKAGQSEGDVKFDAQGIHINTSVGGEFTREQKETLEQIETNIFIYFSNLHNYLQWESLSGGPYQTISRVKQETNNNNSSNRMPSTPGNIKYETYLRLLKFHFDEVVMSTNSDKGLQSVPIMLEFPSSTILKACPLRYFKVNNAWIEYSSVKENEENSVVKTLISNERTYTFNGKKFHSHDVSEQSIKKPKIENCVPPADVVTYIQTQITNNIQNVNSSIYEKTKRAS